jgi:hypothetical protein
MRQAGTHAKVHWGALSVALVLAACSYDFDGLVAQTTGGGEAGAGGASSSGAGGSSGASGTAGKGGSAGTAGDGGIAGTAGKGGSAGIADAATDRGIIDVRAEPMFDCAAMSGTVFQGHCYYPSATMSSWDAANTSGCTAPAHLVVITTSGEQAVVSAILPNRDRWIGLHKDATSPDRESSFKWVTSEALSFKQWDAYDTGAPEPNYTGDCVRMAATNNWGDVGCNSTYAAICERE